MRTFNRLAALGVGVVLVVTGCGDDDEARQSAQATDESTQTSATAPAAAPGISRTELGRGTAAADFSATGAKGSDVVVQSVTIDPGGSSGWHTHPGQETAIIKAGTLTFFDADDPDCAAQAYSAGQTVVGSGHPHMARNLGEVPVEIVVTYYNVPAGGAAASPAGEPQKCAGR